MNSKVNSDIFYITDAETQVTYVVAAVDQYGMNYIEQMMNGSTELETGHITTATTITAVAGEISVVFPVTVTE